jgi:outer membrane protein OmpA-like peptidoglycan-associated protein
MKKYAQFKIEVRAHTDSRGRAEYNMQLSQERAHASMEYIVKGGVNAERVSAKGYGESQLLNRCADGVECDDQEHARNRRLEFYLIEGL